MRQGDRGRVGSIDPAEPPLWLPGDRVHREVVELIRDHWWMIEQCAETYHLRGLAIIDRLSAEERGNWLPRNPLRHRGQDYGFGEYPATCDHPDLRARMDGEPRAIRVVVAMRGLAGRPADSVAVGEYLCHLDLGPPGVRRAGGDPPPGSRS